MKIRKARLSADVLRAIHAQHGHPKGGLSIHDVKTHQKVQITNPQFIEWKQKNHSMIVARGMHPQYGHTVQQIVKKA